MKKIVYILLFIIIIVSEYFLLKSNLNLKQEISQKNEYLEKQTTISTAYQSQFFENIDNCNTLIDKNLIIQDSSYNNLKFSDILTQDYYLILRYSDAYCGQCVEHSISILMDNKEYFDFSKIIFLGSFLSKRNFILSKKMYNLIDYQLYNCQELNIPADKNMFPYYMIIDKNLKVIAVYFPTKSTHGTDFDFKNLKFLYDKFIN
ncbi:MAG: hypothetical protein MJ211_06280 [Bacteroidales bacterium]|nr:hypothetical protein [Bacteroidales bacterium]